MTNKEAILNLSFVTGGIYDQVFYDDKAYEWDKNDYEALCMAIEALTAQQWIPCSDRLPEEDFWSGRGRQFSHHVLVTIVNHGNDDEQFTDMAQTVDGIWQLSHDVDGDCSLPNWCEVIAWMPLPDPWKGDEE